VSRAGRRAFGALLAAMAAGCAGRSLPESFRESFRVALPEVEGRIDHLAIDPAGERLYVCALANGSLEVIDLTQRTVSGRLTGLAEPQGIVFLPETRQIAFTTGGDGKLRVHDAATLAEVKVLEAGGDADNVRLDAKARRLYVGGEEGLAVFDVDRWERIGAIALAGHAESFQLEPGPDGAAARIFVNVPDARHVAVVDAARREVVATWPTGDDARRNYPMALDAAGHRLFVGCREPACLLVLDASDGRRIERLEIPGDCDDLFVDRGARAAVRLFVACGEGSVATLEQNADGRFEARLATPTARGARTALLVPELGRLFVAVPRGASASAEVRVFDVR
jgi:hypothetical protein